MAELTTLLAVLTYIWASQGSPMPHEQSYCYPTPELGGGYACSLDVKIYKNAEDAFNHGHGDNIH